MKELPGIKIIIRDVDVAKSDETQTRFLQAIDQLAKAMEIPLTMRPRSDHAEEFHFQSQDDFVDRLTTQFAGMMDDIYLATCEYLDLPIVKTFTKANIFDRFLKVKGKQLFNPETGKPLRWGAFYNLVRAIEKFLNMGIQEMSKRITLGSASLARLLQFIEQTQGDRAAAKKPLDEVGRGRDLNRLSTDMQAYQRAFKLPDEDMDRMEVVEKRVGDNLSDLAASTLKRVKDVYYSAVIEKKTKQQVAQDLFDRFGDQNRDWRRVVETEHAEIFNGAYLKAEVASAPPGEKVYFKRREVVGDGITCKACQKVNGTIALWSEVPLPTEKIADPVAKVAIWEGKSNLNRKVSDWWLSAGTMHPHCRGSWDRYYPPAAGSEDFQAKVKDILAQKKRKDALHAEAEKETRAAQPGAHSFDPAFQEQLNTIYNAKLKAEGLA